MVVPADKLVPVSGSSGSSADPREKGGVDVHDMTRRPGKFDASSSGFRLRPPPVRRYDDQVVVTRTVVAPAEGLSSACQGHDRSFHRQDARADSGMSGRLRGMCTRQRQASPTLPAMNVTMAIIWLASAAVLLGLALLWTRRSRSAVTVAAAISLGTFLVCCMAMSGRIQTTTTIIDSPTHPMTVQCMSAWNALHGPAYVTTLAGPQFNPANGACESAAWRRVASLGTAEFGLAVLVGLGMALASGRGARQQAPAGESVAA